MNKYWKKLRYFIMFPLFFVMVAVTYGAWSNWQHQQHESGLIHGEMAGNEALAIDVDVTGVGWVYETGVAEFEGMFPEDSVTVQVQANDVAGAEGLATNMTFTLENIATGQGTAYAFEDTWEGVNGVVTNVDEFMDIRIESCKFDIVGSPLGCVTHVEWTDNLTLADVVDVEYNAGDFRGGLAGNAGDYLVVTVDYGFQAGAEDGLMGDSLEHTFLLVAGEVI